VTGGTVTVAGRQYGSAELTEAIRLAIRERDWQAVDGLMHLLAVVDPHQAQVILDILDVAKAVSR
jgi:hypothetical protein